MILIALAAILAAALLEQAAARPAPSGLADFDAAWQIVRDTHFDPGFNGVDWARVGEELRPRAAAARDRRDVRAVIQEMLDRLGQSHFVVLPADPVEGSPGAPGTAPRDERGDVGFDVRLVEGQMVVTRVTSAGPSSGADVRPGWIVQAIDVEPVAGMLGRLPASLPPRLRQVEAWRAVTRRLRGPAGEVVRVTFVDASGAVIVRSLTRRPETGEAVTVGNLPTFLVRVASESLKGQGGQTVGLIRFNVWMTPVDAAFGAALDAFRGADGIVVDLRGNPGGLAAMLMGISGYFFDEPAVLGTMKTRESELKFAANPRRVNAQGARVTPYAGPVAILVDAMTGSASECFAGGMQAIGRARVFGQPTMGQALPALFDRLPSGDVLLHAQGDFVTPDGTRLEGRGVIPDEAMPLTRDDLAAGHDRTLEAALDWIARTERAKRSSVCHVARGFATLRLPALFLPTQPADTFSGESSDGTTPGPAW